MQGKLVFFWFHSASWYWLCIYVPFLSLRPSLEVGAALWHLFFFFLLYQIQAHRPFGILRVYSISTGESFCDEEEHSELA